MQGPAGKERVPSGLREAMSSGAIGLELESQMCHLCELRDSTASTPASWYFVTKHLRTWWLEVTVVFISQGSVGGRCRSAESSLVRPWSAAGQLCSFSLLHLAFSNVQGLPWGNGAPWIRSRCFIPLQAIPSACVLAVKAEEEQRAQEPRVTKAQAGTQRQRWCLLESVCRKKALVCASLCFPFPPTVIPR